MKRFNLKKKILNHLMLDGKKKTSEKLLLQSLKELQKNSFKNTKKIVKIAAINASPIFKINTIENKKRKKKQRKIIKIPSFITNSISRVSFAIKLMLSNLKQNKSSKIFYEKLGEEILLASEKKGEALFLKKELQKEGFLKKYLYKRFRW